MEGRTLDRLSFGQGLVGNLGFPRDGWQVSKKRNNSYFLFGGGNLLWQSRYLAVLRKLVLALNAPNSSDVRLIWMALGPDFLPINGSWGTTLLSRSRELKERTGCYWLLGLKASLFLPRALVHPGNFHHVTQFLTLELLDVEHHRERRPFSVETLAMVSSGIMPLWEDCTCFLLLFYTLSLNKFYFFKCTPCVTNDVCSDNSQILDFFQRFILQIHLFIPWRRRCLSKCTEMLYVPI